MMDEYTPCKKPDPTAREAIGNVMRLVRAQNRNKYNLDLLSRKQAGEVIRIGLQPQYTLLEGFRDNTGKKQRTIAYTADFFHRLRRWA